ncbi:MAG: hypothetical protein JKY52_18720 [Flavobacteriales bacterium]|nr:hypothetical protein [Flavobacteriales bacterium]
MYTMLDAFLGKNKQKDALANVGGDSVNFQAVLRAAYLGVARSPSLKLR